MESNWIEKTESFLKGTFSESAWLSAHPEDRDYRLEHSYRVANIAKTIAEAEGFPAAYAVIGGLLHDIAYCEEMKGEADWKNHGRRSAAIARPFLLGLITLLDLLPLIGSGMILLPWGLWELLQGRTALGAGLWLLFGCTEVLRAILEPRLLGAGGGAPPLLLTAALFAGLRLGGALGAMLFPAAVLFLWDLNRQGKLPGLTAG